MYFNEQKPLFCKEGRLFNTEKGGIKTEQLDLYMPMTVESYPVNEYGEVLYEDPERYTDWQAAECVDVIREALIKERMPEEAEHGLMVYYGKNDSISEKVYSVNFDVDVRGGKLWGVAECELSQPLTPVELMGLIDYVSGQASDGFGEGFEQRELEAPDGSQITASLWSSDDSWTIQTEQERFGTAKPEICLTTLPHTGELVYVQRGESGYTHSELDTGKPEQNRRIADYMNQKRGISPEQEQAMARESVPEWDTLAAEPQNQEQPKAAAFSGMSL